MHKVLQRVSLKATDVERFTSGWVLWKRKLKQGDILTLEEYPGVMWRVMHVFFDPELRVKDIHQDWHNNI